MDAWFNQQQREGSADPASIPSSALLCFRPKTFILTFWDGNLEYVGYVKGVITPTDPLKTSLRRTHMRAEPPCAVHAGGVAHDLVVGSMATRVSSVYP